MVSKETKFYIEMIVAMCLVETLLLYGSTSVFPRFISQENILEMLRAILQLNGVFIGFIAIISAFIFGEISRRSREKPPPEPDPKTLQIFSLTTLSIVCCLFSILACLYGMAQLTPDHLIPFFVVQAPLVFMILAMVFLISTYAYYHFQIL